MTRVGTAGVAAACGAALLLASCDRAAVVGPRAGDPPAEPPAGAVVLHCSADVRAGEIRCEAAAPRELPPGVSADRVVGGQDRYVLMSSTGTGYDEATESFRSTVTVQNLTRHLMGTSDGVAVEGVRVFFHTGPTVVDGSGVVTVANPSGTDAFTGSNQPYFAYPEILAPMHISEGRLWEFHVPRSVETFVFTVYVSTPMIDETAALLGPVWTGADSTSDWSSAGNWAGGGVPDSAATATVPPDSMLDGAPHPVLGADAAVRHLRVGRGSVLDLGGNRLVVVGNADATGAVVNGTVRLESESGVVGGTLPTVEVAGAVALQRAVTTMGPVRVTGALAATDAPLSIRIP